MPQLMPYGSRANGLVVSKVLYDSGKMIDKSGALMPYGSHETGPLVSKVQVSTGKNARVVIRRNGPA